MTDFNRNSYKGAIDSKNISNFIEWSENSSIKSVEDIQNIKKNLVEQILIWWKINSQKIKKSEEAYLDELIWKLDWKLDWKFTKETLVKELKKEIEAMQKPQTIESLWEHNKWYIWNFDNFINLLHKYVSASNNSLDHQLNDNIVKPKIKKNIKEYQSIFKKESINNTRKRELLYDEDIFNLEMDSFDWEKYITNNDELGNSWNELESKRGFTKEYIKYKNNIECFYEEDFDWNKNYFSLNTLIHYTDTFWVELWLFDSKGTVDNFSGLNRKIKHSMTKNILQDLRDKQEILMYGFKDYELESGVKNYKKAWFIAEKIVELEFRELAELSEYKISIVKASVGEDQNKTVDLFIILKDEKTWVEIEREIQLTIKNDINIKKEQIAKRNKELKKMWSYTDSELVQLTLKDLWKKIHAWKYFNRPIWKLSDILDNSENVLIRETFNRLVLELKEKQSKV